VGGVNQVVDPEGFGPGPASAADAEAGWHTSEYPELRAGPPWVTEQMVAAQPGVVRGLLDSPPDGLSSLAGTIREAADARLPVTVVGCGTSEHGAMAVASLLATALGGGWPAPVVARQSLDAAEAPQRGGVCIGISHDGGTRATTLALEAAAAGGARTALVTARPGGTASGPAELVLVTPVHDDSWCHTVAYTSAIAVGGALARELGLAAISPAEAEALLRDELAAAPEAAVLAGSERVLCAGAGIDLVTARELALKLAEGARVQTAALHLETLLHGHLAGEDAGTAVVLVDSDRDSVRIGRRAEIAEAAVGAIGMPVHRLGVRSSSDPLARLLGGAAALQALTLELVRARRVNPDLIRREEEPYRNAGAAGDADW
jgi:glutamine---fructose-6-phosphate transaminase (isomerizing)